MNKVLKVYFAKVPNMGDYLNVLIIEKLFGYQIKRRTFLTGELSAIGSGLGQFTLRDNPILAYAEKIAGRLFPSVTIWGTGFVCYKENDTPFYRKKMRFAAVRGELSKTRVEKILGEELNIPTGDAGILSCYLLNEPVEKKYKVGVIAHYKEQDEGAFQQMMEFYPNASFIDVRQHPSAVIKHIAACECIVSSSLHGLIIADSLGIPNIHVKVTDKLLGDGFKFDDYYSAYHLPHLFVDTTKDKWPTVEWIKEHYLITTEMTDAKKRDMIKSFPYKHSFMP